MQPPSTHDITRLLIAWNNGDSFALDQLMPLVHAELHRIARRHMARERPGHILQTSALVNEAYLRLIDWKDVEWQNRAHFFGLAARIMRNILVDFARARGREKREGDRLRVSMSQADRIPNEESADLVALDDALQALEKLDARQARVVELRFFGGLSMEETAEALNVSVGTVKHDSSIALRLSFVELSFCCNDLNGAGEALMSAFQEIEKLLSRMSRAEKAQLLQLVARDLGDEFPGIESSPDVCGGEPRIIRTRIPVWTLEQARRLGTTEAELLRIYPSLRAQDLANAWAYVRSHKEEIEQQIQENEAA